MEKGTTLFRFDASSSVNANLRVPLNGAALGTLTLTRPARLKSISIFTDCYLNDSAAGSWNTNAKGLVLISGSYFFGNPSSFGLTAAAMDAGQIQFNKILPPGSYTLTGTLMPVVRMHPVFDPTAAGPVWNTCTVGLIVIIEMEEDIS